MCSDPGSRRLYHVHPDSSARANLTVYSSLDDGASWGGLVTVYAGAAAYSDSAVLDPKSAGGEGRQVGVLFERDSYAKIAFARVHPV